ncbi:MAG: hypothetical protein JNM56_17895 [Planctomycetia bacterium]|nr:hypothetical protein [Planctomycetia bacterium]
MKQLVPTALCWLLALNSIQAAPPTATALTPRGAQRGQTVEIVVAGTNLSPQTRLLLPFKAEQKLLPDAKPNPAQVRLQLTVDAATPLGVYPIRVATEDGVSALTFFSVEAFPNVNEAAGNTSFEKAQKVPFPVVINGQCAGGNLGFFRFPAAKGQRVVVEALSARLGSALLPQIRVTDARQRFLAADDSQALGGDVRVIFQAPEEGEYVVEIADSRYRGGNPPYYRLLIADYDVAEEVFPLGGRRGLKVGFTLRGGTLTEEKQLPTTVEDPLGLRSMLLPLDGLGKLGMPSPRVAVGELPEIVLPRIDPKPVELKPPVTVNGRLERKGDQQRFQLAVEPGQRYRFAVQAEALGSYLDGVLRVLDPAGKQLALVDDVDLPATAPGQQPIKQADPALEFSVPMGVTSLTLELRDQRQRGGVNFGYRLTVEPALPDFELRQPVSEINVPRGGTAALAVPVVRRGYGGPIRLSVANLPPFLTLQGGRVPTGGTVGVLTLSALADAPVLTEPLALRIEGQGEDGDRKLHRFAEQKLTVARDGNPAASQLMLSSFVAGLSSAEPFAVQGPVTVEAVKGYPTTVPVTIRRGANPPVAAVEVTGQLGTPAQPGQPPPGGLAFQPVNAAADAGSVNLTMTPTAACPEGVMDFVIQGKARLNNVDQVVVGPAVMLTVHRPFTIEPESMKVDLPVGQKVLLKGKLARRLVCKEAVQLKLDGLPAGVTLAAPPKPIPAESTEYLLELNVAANAKPVIANLTLTGSANLGGIAYLHPPITIAVEVK